MSFWSAFGGKKSKKGKKVAQEVIQTVRLPHPVYMESAEGGNMTDVDGNTYIDTTMGFGPIILGHNHPVVREAVDKQLNRGSYTINFTVKDQMGNESNKTIYFSVY